MKKILYGVSGIGNGHANRQLPIITELSKRHRIVILAYDESYATFERNFADNKNISLVRIAVPFIVGTPHGLDFGLTASHPANQETNFLDIEWKAMAEVERLIGVPDLAITDYEPVCAQYAYAHNVPLVTIDQQSKFLFADLPKEIRGFTYEDEVQRLHMFFPEASNRIACSFFRTKPRVGADLVNFFPAPIKPAVRAVVRKPMKQKEILVYISSAREFVQTPEEIIATFRKQSDAHFNLFIKNTEIDKYKNDAKNITLFPHGSPDFISLMAVCDGIVSTAGHSLLSEAMYLGIPVYAIPVSPYEQHLNAKVIGDNGFGVDFPKLDSKTLDTFVNNLESYAKNIRNDKSILISGSGQDLIVDFLERNYLSNRKILVFSPPFSGHLNILKELILDKESHHDYHLVITGWENIEPDLSGLDETKVTILNAGLLKETDPAKWTFPRAAKLLSQAIKITEDFDPDLIIYDFFSIEGNFVGKLKNIPYWCSVPAMIGPYENKNYCKEKYELKVNQDALRSIEKEFGISIQNNEVEMVSDGFHLPGQINLVWSFLGVTPENFMENRADLPYVFVGNLRGEKYEKRNFQNSKPLIYFSLGTVVMNNLWNQQEEVREKVARFVKQLANKWQDKDLQVIFVTQGKKILEEYPENWWVYDSVNQVEILSKADIFITHGGSNSFHEAVMQKIPMLVIPFFGDQILVSHTTEHLGFGVKIGGSESIDTEAKKDFINDELVDRLDAEVERMLKTSTYTDNYLKRELSFMPITTLLRGQLPIKSGDVIVGDEVKIPENKENLPTSIEKYLELLAMATSEIYPIKVRRIVAILKRYTRKQKSKEEKRKRLLKFFTTCFRVHRTNKNIDKDTPYPITDYKKIGSSWVPEDTNPHFVDDNEKVELDNKIVVASNNSLKKQAVEKVVNSFDRKIDIKAMDPELKVDEQLVGIENIIWVAYRRLRATRKMIGRRGSVISIQSGIYENKGKYRDVAIIIVDNSRGDMQISKSREIQLPTDLVLKTMDRGFDKHTVGSIIAEEKANHAFGFDPHRFVTKAQISRLQFIVEALGKIID